MTLPSDTDILVVGGGLAGLRLAEQLTQAGRDVQLIEARDRHGGRILSVEAQGAHFDLGPAWFWDGQPRMAALAHNLGLQVFEQFSLGDARFEDQRGRLQQGRGIGSMQGSFRVSGGLGALTDGLGARIPDDRLHLNTSLSGLSQNEQGLQATLADGTQIHAQHVVLALPPRIAAGLAFSPALSPAALQAMTNTPTWMAGQAKALMIFDRPFWRDMGLSGEAMSQFGPMVEIHDASPVEGTPGALFGFIGVPPAHRQDKPALDAALRQQVVRLFGPDAPEPQDVIVKDWAETRWTATERDLAPLTAHPRYGLPAALNELWEGRLHFGNTEVAAGFGGFLEGALEAADAVLHKIAAPEPRRLHI